LKRIGNGGAGGGRLYRGVHAVAADLIVLGSPRSKSKEFGGTSFEGERGEHLLQFGRLYFLKYIDYVIVDNLFIGYACPSEVDNNEDNYSLGCKTDHLITNLTVLELQLKHL
jgi:hypothetical protein